MKKVTFFREINFTKIAWNWFDGKTYFSRHKTDTTFRWHKSNFFFLTRFLNSSSSILRCVGVCAQIALYYYGYSQSKNPPFLRLCSSGLHGLLLVEAGLCTGWIIPPPFKTTGNLSVCESHVIRNKSALNNWLVFVIVVSNRFLKKFFKKYQKSVSCIQLGRSN